MLTGLKCAVGGVALGPFIDQTPRPVFAARRHMPQLDGLRGLAILLVTVYRFGREIPDSNSGAAFSQTIGLGSHGVELFFVLSGFLITGILLDSRGEANQLRNFFARRSLRILPLYFAALAICLWIVPALAILLGSESIQNAFAPACQQQWYLWTYMTNVRMSVVDAWCFGPMDHFWSLAVEEHFYWLWPLVILFARPRWTAWLTAGLLVACLVSRTAWLASGGAATVAEVSSIWRCDGLLMGALIAMFIRSGSLTWQRATLAARWLWLPLLIMAITVDVLDRRIWLMNTTLWNAVWCCLLVQLMSGLTNGGLSWFFCQNWLRFLGKLSYGMYVFQAPLIPIMAAAGWSAGVSFSVNLLYVPVMFALSLGVAWCSWHGFEKHWLRLKDLFPQAATERSEGECPPPLEPSWRTAGATP